MGPCVFVEFLALAFLAENLNLAVLVVALMIIALGVERI